MNTFHSENHASHTHEKYERKMKWRGMLNETKSLNTPSLIFVVVELRWFASETKTRGKHSSTIHDDTRNKRQSHCDQPYMWLTHKLYGPTSDMTQYTRANHPILTAQCWYYVWGNILKIASLFYSKNFIFRLLLLLFFSFNSCNSKTEWATGMKLF